MTAVNTFARQGGTTLDSGQNSFAVTPSDTASLPFVTRALYVGGAGNISVLLINDTVPVTLMNAVAGSLLPLRVSQVMNTNTTATNLVGIY
jgi:hypothetical protein